MLFYNYLESRDRDKTDEDVVLSCLYNSKYNTFITAHPKTIKTWAAHNGKLLDIFSNLCKSEITYVTHDRR